MEKVVSVGHCERRTAAALEEPCSVGQEAGFVGVEAEVKSYKLFWLLEKGNAESVHC